ncbi:hypothetical protein RhiJN_02589 [Ceratobasidium sp. AG-Ba]|nr:hypothetical protein RhiJN_02589 [Ceratobasidium sp. AG-Ba]
MIEARVEGKPTAIPLWMLQDKKNTEKGDSSAEPSLPGSEDGTVGQAADDSEKGQEQKTKDKFAGLSFVGATASLHGLAGLKAMANWFDDSFDWFWIEITKVDVSYKVITPIAEYALMVPWLPYYDDWASTLRYVECPACDEWPKHGTRPKWWPDQYASDWPYARTVQEQYKDILAHDHLSLLTSNLHLEPNSNLPRASWGRMGPKGVLQAPGEPLANTSHSDEWVLARDAGLQVTTGWHEEPEDGGSPNDSKSKGKRAAPAGRLFKRRSKARIH